MRPRNIPSSATVEVSALARRLAASGRNIISLSSGEPDFPVPAHIQDAAEEAIRTGRNTYTDVDGIPALKKAICQKFARENFAHYSEQEVSVSTGAKQVIYNALASTLLPGDEVVILAPYWVSYPKMVTMLGATPVVVKNDGASGYRPDIMAIERAIGPKTRWIIVNSPCNPTGVVLTRSDLAAVVSVVERHPNVWLLSDEIYEHLVFETGAFVSLAEMCGAVRDRALLVNGLSKSFNLTGWRLGYGAGPSDLIRAMCTVQSQTTSNPCSITQYAAVSALDGPLDFIGRNVETLRERRDKALEVLSQCSRLRCAVPEGAFYLWIDIGEILACAKEMRTDEDFCKTLLEQTGLALVPGSAFGHERHVRASFATADDTVLEGCRRLINFCEALR
jgi:aspartate aminotransferase